MFEMNGLWQRALWIAFLAPLAVGGLYSDAAQAAACTETTTLENTKLEKTGGGYLNGQQLFNACWALADSVKTVTNCSETLDLTSACETDGKDKIKALKRSGLHLATGKCKLSKAKKTFLDKEATFREVRNALDAVVKGLEKPEPTGTLYEYSSFGPGGGATSAQATEAQKGNRKEAYDQLKKVLGDFDDDVVKYSTLISPDCRKCTILQNYAVLHGAVNLVAHSYTLGTDGHMVGRSNQTAALENTDDDEDESADNTTTKKRLTYADPSNPKSLKLEDLKQDWIAALDADYMETMKGIICKLAKDRTSGAYYQSKKYFPHAAKMQRHINTLFDVKIEKYVDDNGVSKTRLTGVKYNADNASATATAKIKALYDSAGPQGTKPNQCGQEPKIELKAFSPDNPNRNTETATPVWCK